MENNKKKIVEYEVESVSDFIEFVEDKEKDEIILFRGQTNDDPLLPKIARNNPKTNTVEIEKRMVKELYRRSNEFVQSTMKSNWDWLALGQHHGLSTRLLDWTTNPLVALWFSCNAKNLKGEFSVVWLYVVPDDTILDTDGKLTPFDTGKTKVFQPALVGKRLSTQLGWFTVHKFSTTVTPNQFIPLEKNKEQMENLFKLKIPKKLRSQFIGILDTCGVNASTIFPELDGLCNHINWKYSV